MSVQQSEEERQPRKVGAEAALAAYLLGAATVGIALLARALQKKLRRRRRVVRARSNAFVACCAQALGSLQVIDSRRDRSAIGELGGLCVSPTATANCCRHLPVHPVFAQVGVLPARYQSSRFPGKPLVPILGKPMILRTYEQVPRAFWRGSCLFLRCGAVSPEGVECSSATYQ